MLYKTQEIPALIRECQQSKGGHEYLVFEFARQTSLFQQAILIAVHRLAFPYRSFTPAEHPAYKIATKMMAHFHEFNQKLQKDHELYKNHKPYQPSIDMSQDYDVIPPADWVHHERKLENERLGKTYHPPKMVGSKAARRGVERSIVSVGQAYLHNPVCKY